MPSSFIQNEKMVSHALPEIEALPPLDAMNFEDDVEIVVPEDKAGWTTRIIKRRLPTPIVGEGGAEGPK